MKKKKNVNKTKNKTADVRYNMYNYIKCKLFKYTTPKKKQLMQQIKNDPPLHYLQEINLKYYCAASLKAKR